MVQKPKRLGDFEIVREIGRGGMGVVYEATQVSLNRRVALKVLPPGTTPEQRDIERFQREAQAAASLDHPNIVPIYAQGEEEGTHYYAMRLVQGRSLDQVMRATRRAQDAEFAAGRSTTLSQKHFRTAARLIMEVAEALEYAHGEGVIHRDIKPHNLILTPEGHLVITDFGLARFLSAPSITISGEMVGTPAYMSPEQVQAERQAIDHRTDIYSLGVTLYEMLALEVPFRAETREALLRQILMKDPAPLRRLNPRMPRDLETICAKAIEKDPDRRYRSAKLLAHDLHCFLEGLPITARPIGPVGRLYRRAMRRKALTAALAGVLVAVIVGTFFGLQSLGAHRRAEVERQRADQQQRLAEQERLRAETEQRRAEAEAAAKREEQRWNLLGEARFFMEERRYTYCFKKLQEAASIKHDHATYLSLWLLASRYGNNPLTTLKLGENTMSPGSSVESAAFSPDGRTVASGNQDGTVKLWDLTTGRQLRTLSGHTFYVNCFAFSPDGKTLASGGASVIARSIQGVPVRTTRGAGATLKLWDVATGRQLHTLREPTGAVTSLALSPDGKTLASGSWDEIKLWDVATGKELRTLEGHTRWVRSVAFSPDGKTLASGSFDRTIKLWDVATGKELGTLAGHTGNVNSVAFGPDGKTLASGSWDGTIRFWDAATGRELHILSGHTTSVRCVAFNPDGRTVASGSLDNTIKLWDVATGQELRTLVGHKNEVLSVAFSPHGRTLASASRDKTAKLWDLTTGQELGILAGHRSGVESVAFSPDGRLLASASMDKSSQLWKVVTGGKVRQVAGTVAGHTRWVNSLAFSPDGKTLVSGSWQTIKLWDVATGGELRTLARDTDDVSSVPFSPDSMTVAWRSNDVTVKQWDVATGQELRTLARHLPAKELESVFLARVGLAVSCIALSADGTTLASVSNDKTIKLWDVATGRELRTLTGHTGYVTSVAFSPDGRALASGGRDGTVRLWDVATGQELRTLTRHLPAKEFESVFFARARLAVSCIAFSADGTTLASVSNDKTIRLWDVATGRQLRTLTGHTGYVTSVAFSPDGRIVASGGGDNVVKLWDVATGREVQTIGPFEAHVESVVFSPDGRKLACAVGKDILIYDFRAHDEQIERWLREAGVEADTSGR